MNNSPRKIRGQGGFLQIIIVIIVALIALHLLGINLKDLLSKQWVQDFAIYVRDLLKLVWADLKEIIVWAKNLPDSK
jgi:hypothetical protein